MCIRDRLINKSQKFTFHDEDNTAKVGDVVRIEACRPMSRSKRFILKEVIASK